MIFPVCIMISPTVLKTTPMVIKISSHMHHDNPTVLNTPKVVHTHYTGCFIGVKRRPQREPKGKIKGACVIYRLPGFELTGYPLGSHGLVTMNQTPLTRTINLTRVLDLSTCFVYESKFIFLRQNLLHDDLTA